MNFLEAFDKTNKPAAAPVVPQFVQQQETQKSFTDDDMKAYIDAKFEALKSDLMDMTSSNKDTNTNQVETPQETQANVESNNIEEGGNTNASSTDL